MSRIPPFGSPQGLLFIYSQRGPVYFTFLSSWLVTSTMNKLYFFIAFYVYSKQIIFLYGLLRLQWTKSYLCMACYVYSEQIYFLYIISSWIVTSTVNKYISSWRVTSTVGKSMFYNFFMDCYVIQWTNIYLCVLSFSCLLYVSSVVWSSFVCCFSHVLFSFFNRLFPFSFWLSFFCFLHICLMLVVLRFPFF